MTQTSRTSLVALCMVLVAATLALAQPPGFRGGSEGDRSDRLAEYLELTDTQRAQWTAAHESFREERQPAVDAMRELREGIRSDLESASPDPTAIGTAMIEVHALEGVLKDLREELNATLTALLDADQQTKWEAWQASRGGRERHRRRGGFGRRG